KDSKDIYDSNVGGTKNILDAAKRANVQQFIYTSTVATIAVDRPAPPNEKTDAKVEEMIGHYKRSKWMAEREALNAAKEGFPVIVAMPTTPVGPWDWKPTPTGKIIVDFLNGKMPGYVETGLNFVGVEECAAGHLLVADKGKIGERYLLGAENLTLKQLLDMLAKITGLRAPPRQQPPPLSPVRCPPPPPLPAAPPSPRPQPPHRREKPRPPQNVRRFLSRPARTRLPTRPRLRRARARRPLVRSQRLRQP